jgi:hypothetical protein
MRGLAVRVKQEVIFQRLDYLAIHLIVDQTLDILAVNVNFFPQIFSKLLQLGDFLREPLERLSGYFLDSSFSVADNPIRCFRGLVHGCVDRTRGIPGFPSTF